MLKTISLTVGLLCATIFVTNAVYAHGDGGHGVSVKAEDVVGLASKYIVSLVKHKKKIEGKVLDASWVDIATKDKALEREEAWYFVVSIHHAGYKKTLYLMISKKGKLYRVNYNGKFKDFES